MITERLRPMRKVLDPRLLALIAFGCLVAQIGFSIQADRLLNLFELVLALAFLLELVLSGWAANRKREYLLSRGFDVAIVLVALLFVGSMLAFSGRLLEFGPLTVRISSLAEGGPLLVKWFLFAEVVLQSLKGIQRTIVASIRPEVMLAVSFAGLIFAGTILLLLPRSSARVEAPISVVDAFFTSTSAACVTGLVVRDTGTDFSLLGQTIILALFQTGGLGIITFVAFISVFSSKSLPLGQLVVFKNMMNLAHLGDLKARLLGIFLFVFVIEAGGAVALFSLLPRTHDLWMHAYWCLFHSVSAFCNAGFALQANSLEAFAGHPGVNLIIMLLIIFGGLGFLVIPELIGVFSKQGFYALSTIVLGRKKNQRGTPSRLSIQSRLAIIVTVLAAIIGSLGFLLLERSHFLVSEGWQISAWISMFQSISTRTAGFNTIPIGELQDSTLFLLMILMVIGASPVSAGGGIKTATVAVLILTLRAMLLSRPRVEVFGRTLPFKVILAATSVFLLYTIAAVIGWFSLAILEPAFSMRDHLFETISALSTVGLSTGITAQLSDAGKLLLCFLMFIGRIGPISIVLCVFRPKHAAPYDFPEESLVVS